MLPLFLAIVATLSPPNTEVAEIEKVPKAQFQHEKPSSKVQILNRLYKLGMEGDRDQAIGQLEKLVETDPMFFDARKMLALFLEWEKQFAAANVQIDYVLQYDSEDPDALLIKAEILRGMGECEQAIVYYKQALSYKESFKGQMGLVFCMMKMGRVVQATALAHQIEPKDEQEEAVLADFLEVVEKTQTQYVIGKAYDYVDEDAYACAQLLLIEYLCGNPCDHEARLALARIYGLDDEYDLGMEQVCCVLGYEPNNVEALTVMADLYRWRGDYVRSIRLYNELIEESGCTSDEASLGLAYSYLGIGNRSGAHQIACRLEDEELFDAIEKRPFADVTYRFLHDSQDLDISQTSGKFVWWRGNCIFDLNYMHIDSDSPGFGGYLDQGYARLYSPLTTSWDFGGSAGVAHVNGKSYFIGELEALWRLPSSTLYQRGGYYVYNETAEALDNRIRYGDYYINYTYNLTDRQFIGAYYEYQKYSDGNHINYADIYYDIVLRKRTKSKCCCLRFDPELEFRYDIAWQNAAENALNGYFSGKNYLENRGALAIRFYNREGELRLELIPTGAYVTYKTIDHHLNNFFFGGIGNLYAQLKEQLLLITGLKVGKYPFQGPDEYNYIEYAARLIYTF